MPHAPARFRRYSNLGARLILATLLGACHDQLDPDATATQTVDLQNAAHGPKNQIVSLVVSPDSDSLAIGQERTYTAVGKLRDGTTAPITATWKATGGTITGGKYTAGQTVGNYEVIAVSSDGTLADTAKVIVTATITATSTSNYVGCPSGAVRLAPTDNWASKAAAAAAGTVFCALSGTHRNARNIVPKTGQRFIAETKRGAILDGENTAAYAFQTLKAAPADVVIRGLVITRYVPPAQMGAIQGDNGDGWIMEDNEIHHNSHVGLRPGTHGIVRRNYIHHNTVSGIDCWHCHGTLVENDTLTFNPAAAMTESSSTSQAAQIKISYSDNVIVRNNYITDGPNKGIWFDYMNRGVLIEGNRILRQGHAGIWHEVGYDAKIRANIITTCGTRGSSWLDGAGIQMTNSPNVEISGNTISGCANGIGIMMAAGYTDGPYGRNYVANLSVHDNKVTMTTGHTGIGQNIGSNLVFTSWNNRFTNNHYSLGPAAPFAWANGNRTEAQWRGYGQDVSGTFSR